MLQVLIHLFYANALVKKWYSDACCFSMDPWHVELIIWYSLAAQEKSDIRDIDDAKPLALKGGNIEFENVHFR